MIDGGSWAALLVPLAVLCMAHPAGAHPPVTSPGSSRLGPCSATAHPGPKVIRGAALGGLVGSIGTVEILTMAGLSTVVVASWYELGWMLAGAGKGAMANLPVCLFDTATDSPPAKRGFVFTGTAATVGLAAGRACLGCFRPGCVPAIRFRGEHGSRRAVVQHRFRGADGDSIGHWSRGGRPLAIV